MKKSVLYIIIGILSIILLFFVGKSILDRNNVGSNGSNVEDGSSNNQEPTTGTISGTIEYGGLKPEEGDEGYVFFEYRQHNSGDFIRYEDAKAPLEDGFEWVVEDVPTNITYDARAVLVVGEGTVVTRSNTITVTAPANHEVFEFNVTYDMLPDSVIQNNPVELSGYVEINGYIPSGSTLSMYTREKGETGDFEEVVVNTPVTGNITNWSWDKALPGRTYEVKTEAYTNNGSIFASSFVGEKAAPSKNVHFILDSRAEDPLDTANKKLAGTVKVNGNYSSNSSLHIKARVSGESEYKTIATVNPSNSNVSWEWDQAVSGVTYDVKPFIIEQGKDDIRGEAIHTAAPSTSIKLVVDTNHAPSAPDNAPKLEGCKNIEDNKFEATLKFDNVDGADKYNLQVGKSKGTSDVNNSVVNNSGNTDPVLTVNINKDQNYYARYSYTKCEDCEGTGSYSHFSDSLKFKCE